MVPQPLPRQRLHFDTELSASFIAQLSEVERSLSSDGAADLTDPRGIHGSNPIAQCVVYDDAVPAWTSIHEDNEDRVLYAPTSRHQALYKVQLQLNHSHLAS